MPNIVTAETRRLVAERGQLDEIADLVRKAALEGNPNIEQTMYRYRPENGVKDVVMAQVDYEEGAVLIRAYLLALDQLGYDDPMSCLTDEARTFLEGR